MDSRGSDLLHQSAAQTRTCEINGRIVTHPSSQELGQDLLSQYSTYPDLELEQGQATTSGTYTSTFVPRRQRGARSDESPAETPRSLKDAYSFGQQIVQSFRQSSTLTTSSPGTAHKPMAWHQYQEVLAVADDHDRVQIYTVLPSKAPRQSPMTSPDVVLQHELQRGVSALAWRPQSGSMLAVGAEGCVALWALGKGPSGTTVQKSAGRDGSMWVSFLKGKPGAVVTCLAWCPTGRLLAAGFAGVPGFKVWQVATGQSVPLRSSLQDVTILRWSPDGTYLFTGSSAAKFHMWETQNWWSKTWRHTPGSVLSGACWSPNSTALLLSYRHSRQMAVLYFSGKPPSLDAQFLPVSLPLPQSPSDPTPHGNGLTEALIESMDWDPNGERLAVVLGQAHQGGGCAALYATTYKPVVNLRFIGLLGDGAAQPLQAVQFCCRPTSCHGSLLATRRNASAVSFCPLYYVPTNRV